MTTLLSSDDLLKLSPKRVMQWTHCYTDAQGMVWATSESGELDCFTSDEWEALPIRIHKGANALDSGKAI